MLPENFLVNFQEIHELCKLKYFTRNVSKEQLTSKVNLGFCFRTDTYLLEVPVVEIKSFANNAKFDKLIQFSKGFNNLLAFFSSELVLEVADLVIDVFFGENIDFSVMFQTIIKSLLKRVVVHKGLYGHIVYLL